MLYLTCHSVVSLVYGWLGSKMLQGMIYPWGSYNGWFEGLFLKSLYSVIGIFFIILLFALTQGYILVIQIMQEEASSESRKM